MQEVKPRRFPELVGDDFRMDKVMTQIVTNKETICCAGPRCGKVFVVNQLDAQARACICIRCGWLMCNQCFGNHAAGCDLGKYNEDLVGRRKFVNSGELILKESRKALG